MESSLKKLLARRAPIEDRYKILPSLSPETIKFKCSSTRWSRLWSGCGSGNDPLCPDSLEEFYQYD